MAKIRQEYLLCYDIAETKVRNKLFEKLKDHGMLPIQKSVFWGEINRAEKNSIIRIIQESIDNDIDRILFFPVDIFNGKNIFMKGHELEDFTEKRFGIL